MTIDRVNIKLKYNSSLFIELMRQDQVGKRDIYFFLDQLTPVEQTVFQTHHQCTRVCYQFYYYYIIAIFF